MKPIIRENFGTLTRLRRGDIVLLNGEECKIEFVNDCRAKAVPVRRRVKEVVPQTGKNAGQVIKFQERHDGYNISPNSECEILRHEAA